MDQAKILENLRRAHAVMESIDAERVDLEVFLAECGNGCGTHACLAGWLAQDPFFQAQGMYLTERKDPYASYARAMGHMWILSPTPECRTGNAAYDWSWLNELFGRVAFGFLFEPYGDGRNDHDLIGDSDNWFDRDGQPYVSHKELALARLDKRIHQIERFGVENV